MVLLLMRHGIAEPDSPRGDAERALTEKGIARVNQMAEFLKDRRLLPTHYLSSPRRRAKQTAEFVRKSLGSKRKIEITESLDFDGPWIEFVERVGKLRAMKDDSIVLATGHEPCCGDFLSQAVVPVHTVLPFKKGAVAAVEWKGRMRDRDGKLVFYATPKIVRA